jgi:ParB-like chromosome segregation protein Spo0J
MVASLDDQAAIELLEKLRDGLAALSPMAAMPVDRVRWVPIERVQANDYNPNSVAPNEMKLLHTSIAHDGYTQPVVAIFDAELDKFVIVDGFHRYTTARINDDIREMTKGRVPLVVIDKPINDRMASTVRHNRARGKHSVAGMGSMIFEMLNGGMTDAEVCNELGLEAEEMARLKHVTGFSKLFESAEYRQAWTTARMEKLRRDYVEGKCIGEDAADGDEEAGDDPALLAQSSQEC